MLAKRRTGWSSRLTDGSGKPGVTEGHPAGQDAIHRSLGIRDLAAVPDGFLVLAGPALPEQDGSPGSGAAFHWREDGTLTKLRDVGLRQDGIKPEVLLLLGVTATSYRIVVMHDGVPGGSPLEYQISKP